GQGVVAIKNQSVTEYTTRQGLVNDFIRAFCEDRHGNLWIGTDGGVSRWDGKSFKNFSTADGLAYPSVRAIVRSKDGDLWVGTDGGLSRIHNGLFVSDPVLDRLRGDQILAIHEDDQGELWLGTDGNGLFRLKDGKLAHYTVKCGLPDDNIYQILQDRYRSLWFSGRAGIFQISLQNLDSNVDCKPGMLAPTIYGSSEGSEAGEVNGGVQPAGSSTRSGALWFPTIKGAIRIEPDQVRSSRQPKALIEQVIADGRNLPLKPPSRIPPGQGKLEIHYTAPSLHAPEHIRFKYRLEGFDRQWTDAATRRVAYYTNLPPGNYRFRVVAFDNDAPAEGSEADFPFDWQAHFYQTAWFYALCALLVGAMGWAGFRIHMAQTKARYSAVLAERSRLAREMHDTVIQGCVGVSTLLEAASSFEQPPPEMTRDLLDRARVQVRQTLNEAREAVWNLRYASIEAHGIVPALSQLAQRLADEGGVEVRAQAAGTPAPLSPQMTSNLLLVAREAARNALTHANPKTVMICISFARKKVCMEITDDGCGFDLASSLSNPNGHYGIVGMRERIEQLGGQLRLESRPGKGTRVTATIPVRS
ncbi:MAG: sensor histidine kinase, partial [Terriglobia bacterium]